MKREEVDIIIYILYIWVSTTHERNNSRNKIVHPARWSNSIMYSSEGYCNKGFITQET
jgi:hypothetical protein